MTVRIRITSAWEGAKYKNGQEFDAMRSAPGQESGWLVPHPTHPKTGGQFWVDQSEAEEIPSAIMAAPDEPANGEQG